MKYICRYLLSLIFPAIILCVGIIVTSCEEEPLLPGSEDQELSDGSDNGSDNADGDESGENDSADMSVATMAIKKVTATTVQFDGYLDVSEDDLYFSQVTVFYSLKKNFSIYDAPYVSTVAFDNGRKFNLIIEELQYNTTYYYCMVAQVKDTLVYGEVDEFTTNDISVELTVKDSCIRADQPRAEFEGTVKGVSGEDLWSISIQVYYSKDIDELKSDYCEYVFPRGYAQSNDSTITFSVESYELESDAKYYYCPVIYQNEEYVCGKVKEFRTLHPYTVNVDLDAASAADMSAYSSANSYIVSEPGLYKFKTVKGNSSESVGDVRSCSILWESFGTSEVPRFFELIKAVSYKDGFIIIQTANVFKEGNAVVAAKDADGDILWSWHIWMTDQPQEQEYYNGAGIAMDRNLGATSATPGEVHSLGLLYQWGRKDPFLGASSTEYDTREAAASTIAWPYARRGDWYDSDAEAIVGTVEYAIAHPTIFISGIWDIYGWYYEDAGTSLKPVWTATKSIYDPCPPGWHITEGGNESIWAKALDSAPDIRYIADEVNFGVDFSGIFGDASCIWYPFTGCGYFDGGGLRSVGYNTLFWTAVDDGYVWYDGYSNIFGFSEQGHWSLSESEYRSRAVSIRCIKE